MATGTLIGVNGTIIPVETTELLALQVMVGGYIEPITLVTGCTMYVNEEGRMMRLPRNPVAEALCDLRPIVGPVVVVGPTKNGKDTDLPAAEHDRILAALALVQHTKIEE